MSGLASDALQRGTIKGTPGRDIADEAKELAFGEKDKKRRRARRNASPLTRGPLNVNQEI